MTAPNPTITAAGTVLGGDRHGGGLVEPEAATGDLNKTQEGGQERRDADRGEVAPTLVGGYAAPRRGRFRVSADGRVGSEMSHRLRYAPAPRGRRRLGRGCCGRRSRCHRLADGGRTTPPRR